MTDSGWYGLAEDIVLPAQTIHFLVSDIPCPNQPGSHLQTLYRDYQTIEYTYVNPEAAELRRSTDMREQVNAMSKPITDQHDFPRNP